MKNLKYFILGLSSSRMGFYLPLALLPPNGGQALTCHPDIVIGIIWHHFVNRSFVLLRKKVNKKRRYSLWLCQAPQAVFLCLMSLQVLYICFVKAWLIVRVHSLFKLSFETSSKIVHSSTWKVGTGIKKAEIINIHSKYY